jgi:hypothetical protein
VPVCVCVQVKLVWFTEPVVAACDSEAALWATAMALPPYQLSGQGQDASSVPSDRERLAVQQVNSRAVVVPADQLVVGGGVVVEHDVAERRHRAGGRQHQIVGIQLVATAGLRRGDTSQVAAGGRAVLDVGVGNLSDVGQLRVGVDRQRIGQCHREGVAAEVMHLLGQCLNERIELVEGGHSSESDGDVQFPHCTADCRNNQPDIGVSRDWLILNSCSATSRCICCGGWGNCKCSGR